MNILNLIDHTILKPFATSKDIDKICSEAIQYHFASVCINPVWVKHAKSFFTKQNSVDYKIAICTVIGFPLGATSSETKASETAIAIADGADEIDMVMNIGAAKEGDWNIVEADIKSVVEIAKTTSKKIDKTVLVKVILENCYLTKDEIVKACLCVKNAGADFVKTSTGFGTPGKDANGNLISAGATTEDVALMHKTVGSDLGIKAAGGIHSLKEAEAMVKAGATRLGCSAGVTIAKELEG
ncbi:MAG: deoxyribose-phosphate aldolase [Treponema sp. CETP13]|nr:MAG: deoxyribose-phosphate aldolase [Treponema sp. CETP13]